MSGELAPAELADYLDWLRIPSVSADRTRGEDLRRAALWAAAHLEGSGWVARLEETGGPPLVVGRSPAVAGAPTVLAYGHYDVQPALLAEGWTGDPFEPRVRDGFVLARGATDNKGQMYAHLLGFRRAWNRGRALPVNVICLIDGEEEVGSPHLGATIQRLAAELRSDVAVVSDTSLVGPGWPSICLGLRGITCLELRVRGAAGDTHSGMFGGVLPNPAEILSRLLAAARGEDGRIQIPGLLDGLTAPHPHELASWATLGWDDAAFVKAAGAQGAHGEAGFTAAERVWARPTFEINGITSGYQGSGSKTIIPAMASAKITLRLVAPQDPEVVARQVAAFFCDRAPAGVTVAVEYDHGGSPYVLSPEHAAVRAARVALAGAFGRAPALVREGLSIPIVSVLRRELGVDTLLLGLGLPDCRAHGPDESFPLAHLEIGARMQELLFAELAAAARG